MDLQQLFDLVLAFFGEAQLPIILGCIAIDILFGVWASIKENVFDWKKVAQFYRTNVIPYVGGYLTLYIAIGAIPALEGVVGAGLVAASFGVVVANLVASIWANFKRLDLFAK
jgi:hypothetical protein